MYLYVLQRKRCSCKRIINIVNLVKFNTYAISKYVCTYIHIYTLMWNVVRNRATGCLLDTDFFSFSFI